MIIKTELDQDKINNNCIDVEIIESGCHVKKTITFEDYVDSFKNMYNRTSKKNEIKIDCSKLLKIDIVSMKDMTLTFVIPTFDLFLIHNNKPMIWKLPTIICECSTKGDLKFWCIKNKIAKLTTKAYVLNLPHHASNGTVCYGSFKRRKVKADIKEMTEYAISYLETTSTHQITSNLVPSGKNYFKYVINNKDYVTTLDKL